MKKIFALFAVALGMTSCVNDGDNACNNEVAYSFVPAVEIMDLTETKTSAEPRVITCLFKTSKGEKIVTVNENEKINVTLQAGEMATAQFLYHIPVPAYGDYEFPNNFYADLSHSGAEVYQASWSGVPEINGSTDITLTRRVGKLTIKKGEVPAGYDLIAEVDAYQFYNWKDDDMNGQYVRVHNNAYLNDGLEAITLGYTQKSSDKPARILLKVVATEGNVLFAPGATVHQKEYKYNIEKNQHLIVTYNAHLMVDPNLGVSIDGSDFDLEEKSETIANAWN